MPYVVEIQRQFPWTVILVKHKVYWMLKHGNFVVEQNPTKVGPIDKRIKALITEEMSKEENHSHWFLGYPAQSKFQRTNSIHHLEPSDYRLGKINGEWANPIIILHKNASTSASGLQFPSLEKTTGRLVSRNQKCDFCDSVNVEGSLGQSLRSGKHRQVKFDKVVETLKNESEMDAKQLNREIFHHQVKEYADVLEIFKVNKELFLKILQDPDDGVSPGQQISNRKVRLTKSGSFPVADMSRVRYLRPSTLERKQNETWAFPKVEKLVSSTQVSKPDAVRSPKGYNEKTAASLADQSAGSTIKHKTTFSSWGSSRLSNHQRWNRLVMGQPQRHKAENKTCHQREQKGEKQIKRRRVPPKSSFYMYSINIWKRDAQIFGKQHESRWFQQLHKVVMRLMVLIMVSATVS
ncbi:protein TRM32-like [Melia azedarach]|uniref:Protein TRM32-like n=1 Tax=Melia azedarach TaxID=155640 RepID=A0ACC1YRL5_MELAZ|nr:protein TRM32-like [Melia azedarach]